MNLMMAQMGLAGLGAVTDFMAARDQASVERKMQKHRNAMAKMQSARQQNAITINAARMADSVVESESMIQRTSIIDKGKAAVAAAAAGVKGNSVDMTMRDLAGSANRASYAVRRQFNQNMSDLNEQRKSVAIGAVLNQDIQVIPKPSVGSMLLGAGTNLLQIYDSHQPEGSKLIK